MKVEVTVQSGRLGLGHSTVLEAIKRMAEATRYTEFGVAAAYTSVAGVRAIRDTLRVTDALRRSCWLLGLDDLLTHPSAVALARAVPGASVRIAGERIDKRRFHPKVFWLSDGGASAALMVGSANLTRGGLETNAEALVACASSKRNETALLNASWQELWALGTPVTDRLINSYTEEFHAAQGQRIPQRRAARRGELLTHDSATVDPTTASTCWIEVGKITGFQSEQLEIKAEQAPFFSLPLAGGSRQIVTVRLASGDEVEIPAVFHSNQMWRLLLPQQIPEVAHGLRPNRERSPYVAVFRRGDPGVLQFRLIPVQSPEFREIQDHSRLAGTWGRTTAREYGWF